MEERSNVPKRSGSVEDKLGREKKGNEKEWICMAMEVCGSVMNRDGGVWKGKVTCRSVAELNSSEK